MNKSTEQEFTSDLQKLEMATSISSERLQELYKHVLEQEYHYRSYRETLGMLMAARGISPEVNSTLATAKRHSRKIASEKITVKKNYFFAGLSPQEAEKDMIKKILQHPMGPTAISKATEIPVGRVNVLLRIMTKEKILFRRGGSRGPNVKYSIQK